LRVDPGAGAASRAGERGRLTVQKSLTSPLMLIGLLTRQATKLAQDFLTNYAIINLQDELTRVPGVSRVQVFGGQYALRVWVKPDQLAKLGVTATEVIAAMQTQNNVNPAGQIGGEPVPQASSSLTRFARRAAW
jgi:hydrophobic/amphiphilic exporter-1 (mainly G- bacteria), HAE1 family